MSRYASHGQETLLTEKGELKGINFGYGFYSEHEWGYSGREQLDTNQSLINKLKNNPFYNDIIKTPDLVNLLELPDGRVYLTNDIYTYLRLSQISEEERTQYFKQISDDNDDRKSLEGFYEKLGIKQKTPSVTALWNENSYYLLSTDKQSSELLRNLYSEIQRGNVAVSSNYSFLFKDRGLSFVFLDKLNEKDFSDKRFVDEYKKMSQEFEREYINFLTREGLEGLRCEHKYPIEFWNVQIHDLLQGENGETIPQFYLELVDTSKGREHLDEQSMHNLPRYMTGDEIKFLAQIAKSEEFVKFAKAYGKNEIETYLNMQLQLYKGNKEHVEAISSKLSDKTAELSPDDLLNSETK